MADAVQITARGPRAACEAAFRVLDIDEEGGGAVSLIEENEATGVWRIDVYPATEAEGRQAEELLTAAGGLAVAKAKLADADWIALSLSGLPPVIAGRFFIYGAHDAGDVPANAVALKIEAGAAFGTGHHGTTAGCLVAFDVLLKARRFRRVLDVGTGTGVLAIAAARVGSRRVVGADIDLDAVRIAAENAALNAAPVHFVLADGLANRAVRAAAPYDLVFANILARPLIGLAQGIRGAIAPGGTVILSGLLRGQARAVRAAYVARGFRLVRRFDLDAWTTLVMERGRNRRKA
ncbi:MAG TPA: 50S ribosomal protein L11 methyltransferase [Caulobacteraceae bacterium]